MGERQSSESAALDNAPASGIKSLMRWSVLRWVVTGAAALVFAVLFLGSGESASAAAPPNCDAAHNYCYATRWAALDNNYWWWNNYGYAPTVYTGYPGAGCALGNYVCDSNGVPYIGAYTYGWANTPYVYANCPAGNFSCLQNNGFAYTNCPAGNFSCLNNNWNYLNWNGWGGWFPYGYTGVYSGNVTIIAPNGNPIKVGSPYRVAEATPPVQAPVADVQPAPAPAPVAAPVQAPAAPVAPVVTQVDAAPQPAPAQVITSLSAAQQPAAPQAPVATPLSAPTGGSGLGTHVQGTATTVVAAPVDGSSNDDHRG